MSTITASDIFRVLRRGFRDIYFLFYGFSYRNKYIKQKISKRGYPTTTSIM